MSYPCFPVQRVALALTLLAVPSWLDAQQRTNPPPGALRSPPAVPAPTRALDSLALSQLRWREIGPYRGGRSVAVAGSVARPNEYYMGTTGGGVFKTLDGGHSWGPVTDRYFGGTIGAVEVAASNPDIVYVGGGEYPIRGNVAHGDGVWKTMNGGRTWEFMGLGETRHISDVVVHPTNPDLVYVAALGHVFAPNAERGVYRSRDGGRTWQRILFANDSTGAVDLVMDPGNPNVLYAGFWQAGRRPWILISGGVGSGIYKTTDGGDNWTNITRNPGLPQTGLIGNIGLSVSGGNSNRVYAIIEHDSGGVFRSDDAGATWTRTNSDRALRQRAWYYTKIHADTKNPDVVYVNNVAFHKSTDGGRTFRPVRIPHADSHDLWIAPDNPNRMIEGNDGGANVTLDGGRTWTEQDYATAQFYHVVTTNHFPYQVCGAQQDNSTLCGPSRVPSGAIGIGDWKEAGGGESGHIAARWDDPDVVYAGSYGGFLTRKDMRTGLARNVNPWPENPMGHSARDLRYRFQWTFPIITSRHTPNVVYAGSNVVHRSTNGGQSWTVISPDLTYADPATLGPSGGPITRDQTSVEYYATVFALAESPAAANVLWAGSDDGRIHVSRDAGATWVDVTPPDMQRFTRVSSVEPSRFSASGAYVAANRYQLDDFRPYLWKTADFGRTWTRIDNGIATTEFTRVLREDEERPGLLYAGTERGVWVSLNDGRSWQRLQLNLPPVPIHDLAVKEGDLVAGTHGRSFWILDNLSVLRQATDAALASAAHLFKPRDAYRVSWGGGRGGGTVATQPTTTAPPGTAPVRPVGANPPSGAVIQYWLRSPNQEVTLEFLDAQGRLVRSFTSRLDSAAYADSVRREQGRRSREDSLRAAGLSQDSIQKLTRVSPDAPGAVTTDDPPPRTPPVPRAPNRAGANSFVWNMRYPDASSFQGLIMWAASTQGPLAPPGGYQVRLLVNGRAVSTQAFRLIKDPRARDVTDVHLAEQFNFLMRIRNRVSEANDAVKTIRYVRQELTDRQRRLTGRDAEVVRMVAPAFLAKLASVEDSIYQTRNRSNQDPLNYPIRLNNKIAALMGVVGGSDNRPTAQSYEVFNRLSAQLDRELGRMRQAIMDDLANINERLRLAGLPEIVPRAVDVPAQQQVAGRNGER